MATILKIAAILFTPSIVWDLQMQIELLIRDAKGWSLSSKSPSSPDGYRNTTGFFTQKYCNILTFSYESAEQKQFA